MAKWNMQSNELINCIFDELADALNISETMRRKAERAYKALGEWIEDNDEGQPVSVFAQGSFALGTVIRPLSGEDLDYDIDLVCQLPGMVKCPAEEIKRFVGERISENATYASKLCPEGKRCWTLEYDEFHSDVLPCTDDPLRGGTAVRLTHKDPVTDEYSNRYSDPIGYAKWFERCMGEPLAKERKRYARKVAVSHGISCSVEDVPIFVVRTPLQKAVQILKHHRNVTFEDRENAPISIIISTLAAYAYRGEEGTYDAVVGILRGMKSFDFGRQGSYRILNPADEKENFADKWNEEPAKARAFFEWLDKAVADFCGLADVRGFDAIGASLEKSCGKVMAHRTMKSFANRVHAAEKSSSLFATSEGLALHPSSSAHAVPRHMFYGC